MNVKLIIAGGRDLTPSIQFIRSSLTMLNIGTIIEIVSGGAPGVDTEGEHFASHLNLPVKRFNANWDEFGAAAGPIRNKQMAEYGDCLLLIWDGESKGSSNMKKQMLKLNKPVYEVILCKSN